MRSAYELARTNAYNFSGVDSHPVFVAVDDITFEKPVTVGSIVKHESWIACTDSENTKNKRNAMQVLVRTWIKTPNHINNNNINNNNSNNNSNQIVNPNKELLSNLFSFTYVVPDRTLPKVVPISYHESIVYLYGRRGMQETKNVAVRNGSLLAPYL